MSDEEEILFDDIYEVASHCQHSYFIVTIVVIVFLIILGNTNKVNNALHCNGDDDGDDDEAFQSTHDPDRPNYITACSDVPI